MSKHNKTCQRLSKSLAFLFQSNKTCLNLRKIDSIEPKIKSIRVCEPGKEITSWRNRRKYRTCELYPGSRTLASSRAEQIVYHHHESTFRKPRFRELFFQLYNSIFFNFRFFFHFNSIYWNFTPFD